MQRQYTLSGFLDDEGLPSVAHPHAERQRGDRLVRPALQRCNTGVPLGISRGIVVRDVDL